MSGMLRGLQLNIMIGPVIAQPAPPVVAEALISAQVTVSAGQRSGFQLVFNAGKGAPIMHLLASGYFDPPTRVILSATLNGAVSVLMDGVITRHDIAPSNEPGQSKLTLVGEDLSRVLDLIDFSWFMKYPAMPAEARVALMLAKYGMYGIVPMIVPSVNIDVPLPLDRIPSHQGTDLQYIELLARNVGYVFYLVPGPVPGVNIGYWGPEFTLSPPQPPLIVDSDAETNVENVSFSFDGFSKTIYALLIQDETSKTPIPIPIPDINPLSPPLGLRPPIPLRAEPLTGVARYTPAQAVMIGLARAAKASQVVNGSGSLDVLRYGRVLQARQLVEVRGAGLPHDGLHYVKSVTHNLKPGEFKQSFSLSRNAFLPLAT
jgi:hypothetical protein